MVDLSDFKVSHYPDGHKHIVSNMDLKGDTELSASIHNFDDLFLIAQIKRIHPELHTLNIKYLLAGRCDRRFSPGEAIDIEIVCDYINSLDFVSVRVLKPHSRKTIECLKYVSELDETRRLIDMCVDDIGKNNCYISPDAGASQWIQRYNLSPLIQCNKQRNSDGKISIDFMRQHPFKGLVDDLSENLGKKNFVIVDDLCDGGATFTTIADAIHLRAPHAKIYLIVTHAIFSKGFQPFEGKIERIFCTNSFADFDNPLVEQIKL